MLSKTLPAKMLRQRKLSRNSPLSGNCYKKNAPKPARFFMRFIR